MRVEGADAGLRDAVQGEDVEVGKDARFVVAVVGGLGAVPDGLGVTSCGADGRVVGVQVDGLDKCGLAGGVEERRVDGGVEDVEGEAGWSYRGRGLVVSIRASDYHVECAAPLTLVCGSLGCLW